MSGRWKTTYYKLFDDLSRLNGYKIPRNQLIDTLDFRAATVRQLGRAKTRHLQKMLVVLCEAATETGHLGLVWGLLGEVALGRLMYQSRFRFGVEISSDPESDAYGHTDLIVTNDYRVAGLITIKTACDGFQGLSKLTWKIPETPWEDIIRRTIPSTYRNGDGGFAQPVIKDPDCEVPGLAFVSLRDIHLPTLTFRPEASGRLSESLRWFSELGSA